MSAIGRLVAKIDECDRWLRVTCICTLLEVRVERSGQFFNPAPILFLILAKHVPTDGQFLKNQIARLSSVGNSSGFLSTKILLAVFLIAF